MNAEGKDEPNGPETKDAAAQKQSQLLNQGRRVEVEGREITVVSKEALLKFIEANLPQGQDLSGQDVLTIYSKVERLEAERKEALLRQKDAEAQAEAYSEKLANAEKRIAELEQQKTEDLEKINASEARIGELTIHEQNLAQAIADQFESAASAEAQNAAEIDRLNNLARSLEDRLALISGSDAEKLARIEALERREAELVELVTRYRRDLTFASGIRDLDSKGLLTDIEACRQVCSQSQFASQFDAELDRLKRLIEQHEVRYPTALQAMNQRKSGIDTVVELCRMAREDILVRRELNFLNSLVRKSVEVV